MATHVSTPGVFIEERPQQAPPIAAAPTAVTAFIGLASDGPVHEPVPVDSWTGFQHAFGGPGADSTLAQPVQQFFVNGGQQALIVRLPPGATAQSAWVPVSQAARQRREGLYALDTVDFNLLCLPPPRPDRDFSASTWARAAAYCRQRRAVLLVDAPKAWTSNTLALQGMSDLRVAVGPMASTHVAAYHPRLRVADPLQPGATRLCPPCGAVAGVMARTDALRGVWKAPAGLEATVLAVQGTQPVLTTQDSEQLNPAALNALRILPGPGVVVWGARTLAGDTASEWRYLPVRRLALFVEQSVLRSTGWVVFEPNDEPLWTRLRTKVQDFLEPIWRQGGLVGQKPEQAFFVRCDRSTMTQADMAAGRLRLHIGLAPLKPAEFVLLVLTLRAAG
jgi:phage tail sheath protein FI